MHLPLRSIEEDLDSAWLDSVKPVFKVDGHHCLDIVLFFSGSSCRVSVGALTVWCAPKYFEERTPDTLMELQERSIIWHYKKADDEFGEIQVGAPNSHS